MYKIWSFPPLGYIVVEIGANNEITDTFQFLTREELGQFMGGN